MNGIHLIRNDKAGVTIQFYALIIAALLQLILKQKLIEGQASQTQLNNTNIPDSLGSDEHSNTRDKDEGYFIENISKNLEKYWKIGINWLTTLRSLLSEPFDNKATDILNSS